MYQLLVDPYDQMLMERVERYGGMINAHTHLDRSHTTDGRYLSHLGVDAFGAASLPLSEKQNLTGDLHRGKAYEPEDFRNRVRSALDTMITLGTREVWSCVDTTADFPNINSHYKPLHALELAVEIKEQYKNKIKFLVGAYPIFGFRSDEPQRYDIFRQGAQLADFIVALPERDKRPFHVGDIVHFRRTLQTSYELGKPVQVHVDQSNDPRESYTEKLIEAVKWLGPEPVDHSKDPMVWAVHAISPSTYDEDRFKRLLDGLLEYHIGVIVCPSAAISMRQLRPIYTQTHNSIARVLEMIKIGVPVRIGSDNIGDFFVPNGTPNLYKEVWLLSNATRFYISDIWAKVLAGVSLTAVDRKLIKDHLDQDREVWEETRRSLEKN